ncbi:hypothetical protein ACP3T3_01505 [Chryseobacterium sp. CBSDS_008]|uniref:hypothetical protein n=1 Tax=Chryseobacterium sp. CBSDS_008 TaxID=3415265 RepID=UPI003CF8EFE8
MKKALLFCLFSVLYTQAQVGILTSNPQGAFHVDAGRDNPTTGAPTAAQQLNDFIVAASSGFVGIGTTTPTNRLHVVGNGVDDPVSVSALNVGDTKQDYLLGITSTGVIKSLGTLDGLSIPLPALFTLGADANNFLASQAAGSSQVVNMSMIKNAIPGLTWNGTTKTITLPAGTYVISFTYEALHNSPGCDLSSYFFDFPNGARVHSNAPHIEGILALHGGTISYTTKLTNSSNSFTINLGRGQAGNCTGTGMLLKKNSTHLLIYRIGA